MMELRIKKFNKKRRSKKKRLLQKKRHNLRMKLRKMEY